MTNHDQRSEQGLVLVMVMVIVSILMILGLSLISQTTSQYLLTSTATANNNALYTAEAGVEQSIQALNANDSFSGYATPQQFFDTPPQGYGIFTTTITAAPGNANAKLITSVGKVFKHHNHSELVSTRTIEVTVVGTTSDGYSVMTGPGGLILNGSANITNSSVYVGGTITLNGSSKIGTVNKPLDVNVGNYACPSGSTPGPSYPALCSGTQPITMAASTRIYGSVCATGQTSTGPNNNIQPGNGGQGLISGCTAPAVSQYTYDKTSHVSSVAVTGTGNSNSYTCQQWPFNRTWPANLQLTGNVAVENSCNIVVKGNTYITGDLTIGGAATIRVDDSVGTTRPVILVDGKVTVKGSAAITSNASGTGVEIISWDSNAPCGSGCTNITGTDLKRTSTFETVSVSGAVSVPGVVFNAYWGQVTLGGSGNVGSAIGQTVSLNGAGTVTFGTQLSTGVSTWTISSYRIKYPGQ